MIARLAEQENGSPEARRLGLQLLDGLGHAVEDGGARVSGIQTRQLLRHIFCVVRECLHQVGPAIETDERHPMLDVADQRIEDGVECLIIGKVARSCAAGLNEHGQGKRLAVGVLLELDFLGDAVVADGEIIRGEREDHLAVFRFHEHGNFDEGGADGEGWGRVGNRRRLLLAWVILRRLGAPACSYKTKQHSDGAKRPHPCADSSPPGWRGFETRLFGTPG